MILTIYGKNKVNRKLMKPKVILFQLKLKKDKELFPILNNLKKLILNKFNRKKYNRIKIKNIKENILE